MPPSSSEAPGSSTSGSALPHLENNQCLHFLLSYLIAHSMLQSRKQCPPPTYLTGIRKQSVSQPSRADVVMVVVSAARSNW